MINQIHIKVTYTSLYIWYVYLKYRYVHYLSHNIVVRSSREQVTTISVKVSTLNVSMVLVVRTPPAASTREDQFRVETAAYTE